LLAKISAARRAVDFVLARGLASALLGALPLHAAAKLRGARFALNSRAKNGGEHIQST
jgi:hypothetical protein